MVAVSPEGSLFSVRLIGRLGRIDASQGGELVEPRLSLLAHHGHLESEFLRNLYLGQRIAQVLLRNSPVRHNRAHSFDLRMR